MVPFWERFSTEFPKAKRTTTIITTKAKNSKTPDQLSKEELVGMELLEYWRIIRKRLWLVLLIPIIAAVVSGVYAQKTLKPTYKATATLIMNIINQQAAPNSNTVSGIVTSQIFDQAVLSEFPQLYLTPSQMAQLISVNTSGDLLYITSTGPNQQFAAAVANSVAKTIVDQGTTLSLPGARLINPADGNRAPVLPSKTRPVIMAFAIGLLASLAFAFMREYLDMRITTEADLARFLNVPVLGSVGEYRYPHRKSKRSLNQPS